MFYDIFNKVYIRMVFFYSLKYIFAKLSIVGFNNFSKNLFCIMSDLW